MARTIDITERTLKFAVVAVFFDLLTSIF